MPTLRSQINKLPTANMQTATKEKKQWIMIGSDDVLMAGNDEKSFHKIPHPHNGVPSLFLFYQKKVYELMKFKEEYRSWFIDNSVQKDGALHIVTPVDPLFLVLPYFEKAAQKDQYTTLDNILHDDNHNIGLAKLENCVDKEMLQNICTCKGDDEFTAYKLNEDKMLEWLSKKVRKLSLHLQKSSINVCPGAQLSSFVKSSTGKKSEDDCLRYAWTTISDYITSSWSEKLKDKLSIKDALKLVKEEDGTPPAKKQKLSSNTECLEDYRDHSGKKTKKSATKLSSQQKSLLKVNKKGMKSMTSFFKSTPKK